jgi:glycosyltransferase involved in cell wall biosynthesis
LAPAEIERPVLLSVGRLAPIKNQGALVDAWSRGVYKTHNLVLVGGDLENPSAEEKVIIDGIRSVLDVRRDLKGRFCHLPGTSNAIIRKIQAAFAARRLQNGSDVYVCPSRKEEFGLSILEAMAAGMIVCAPISGGAGSYIRHGVNGFLIDTRSASTLTTELSATALAPDLRGDRAEQIRENARATIARDYSIERISKEFARFYAGLPHA